MVSIGGDARPYVDPELAALVEANPPDVNADFCVWREASEAAFVEPPLPAGYVRESRYVASFRLPTSAPQGASEPAEPAAHSEPEPTGRDVEVRVIAREGVPAGAVMFVIHGGGYVAGRAKFEDARCLELIAEFSEYLWPGGEKALVTAAPDYALAPDYPHPGGLEDTATALRAVFEWFEGVPVVLYGDSAGSGMIRQLLARLSDAELARLAGVIALEPCLSARMDTGSFETYAGAATWSREAAEFSWDAYFAPGTDRGVIEPPISQVSAGFPLVWIGVNPVDTLRDEGIAWYTALADAGAKVELHAFPGTFHGWLAGLGTRSWARVKESLRPFLADAVEEWEWRRG
ncbi:acetyl esterase/lipase [Arcanobacterium wilhelmae]|uniref:Acetyl esterase/lipase n=1 Tax=Arcanobacterium wilhelmae TaxID=1803177 RepID=A0ABT9NAL8_9ACTO|nr:alpha/beta hydrolase fold domain-containing protein [Arcanobacterium wilhelmae]MDP9800768.1 acetyl esterase/lipase [Arcanobacterium wilhelmae]WFN90149.1 alpha/beta hydrolase fold domain-containing protein [Arcanobacterium wilhelmae]